MKKLLVDKLVAKVKHYNPEGEIKTEEMYLSKITESPERTMVFFMRFMQDGELLLDDYERGSFAYTVYLYGHSQEVIFNSNHGVMEVIKSRYANGFRNIISIEFFNTIQNLHTKLK